MVVIYKSIWKILIDNDMKKCKLRRLAGISTAFVTKMDRNSCMTTNVFDKICPTVECDIEDIIEIEPKE